mgnify:CR=1 FL=1
MRGQLEIMGVVVIVVLLLFLGIIFIAFKANKQESAYSDIRTNTKAVNIVNGLIKLDYDGKRLSYGLLECSRTGDCNGVKSRIELIMQVLKENNYNFRLRNQNSDVLDFGNCEGDRISYNYPLSLEGEELVVSLILCSK